MTVVIWPADMAVQVDIRCIVCRRNISVIGATVGLLEAESDQAFSCDAHLGRGESSRFLRAWIDFPLEPADAFELDLEGGIWQTSSWNDASSVTA